MNDSVSSANADQSGRPVHSAGWNPRISITWELAAYTLLFASALILRLWDLGSRALHHDESLHARFAYDLFAGNGFEHTPVLHGPLQFFGTAFAYLVSGGASDVSARILPALLGTALVLVPFFLRRQLGTVGALAIAALLAFSPTLLYFSRFARNDIWIAVFTLVLIVAIWRYLADQRHRYLYLIAGVLALSFATKETTFLFVGTLLLFLNIWVASELAHQTQRHLGEPERVRPFYTLAYLPLAWLIVALWPFIGGARAQLGIVQRIPTMDVLLIIGTLAGPQFAAVAELPFDAAGLSIDTTEKHRLLGYPTVIALILASAVVGLRWNIRVWALCASLFYVPYTLLYTAFFTDISGFGSGIWESLDYWMGQHDARRAGQPDFYYLMLLPAYELLALAIAGPALLYYTLRGGLASWLLTATTVVLLLAFFGADSFEPGGFVEALAVAALPAAIVTAFFAVKGTMFERFLVFWTASSIVAYSFFGEKFPWLSVHTTLPVVVLAGYTGGRVVEALFARSPSDQTGASSVAFAFARRWALPALAVAVLVPVAAFTVWTGIRVTHGHGDQARELLIYTQTTSDVPRIAGEIVAVAGRSGLDDELRVQVDRPYTWPWAWYLRDYDVTFDVFSLEFTPEPGAVVVVSAVNDAIMNPFREDYQPPQAFTLREWFQEDYRGIGERANVVAAISNFASDVIHRDTWENWWDFMIHRDLPRSGLTGFVYIPHEYGPIDAVEPPPDTDDPEPTPRPGPDLEGRVVIGGLGDAPGQMTGPIGVTLDAAGNVYVVDNGNNRIQNFDAEGQFATVVGGDGSEPAQFNQPSDIAVDADGNIWVADTWNHRIQKFSPDLEPLLTYGVPTNDLVNPADDALWGPRGIAVGNTGNIAFTDTGTHRVRIIAPDGTYLTSFGSRGSGPGEFEEPVGITVAPDGAIYVADAGNARIQKFGADLSFIAEFPIEEWEDRDPRNKPHLAAMPDGRLLATDGPNGRLLLIDGDGTVTARLAVVAEVPLFFPAGVTFDAERAFVWITDAAASVAWRFPLTDFALR